MAGKNPVADVQEVLSYEQQLEVLPELPARPFLLPGDYPEGEVASMGEAKFRTQLWERERDSRQALSGYNAQGPYGQSCGPESPAQEAQRLEEDEEIRRNSYGLPDSPEDMPPMAGGERSRPF